MDTTQHADGKTIRVQLQCDAVQALDVDTEKVAQHCLRLRTACPDGPIQFSLLVERATLNLDNAVLAVRKAALTSLQDMLVGQSALEREDVQVLLERSYKALFKSFADPSEACRDRALRLTTTLFHQAQDITPVLAFLFPLFVHDAQAHEAYQRGKTVPRQDQSVHLQLVETSEDLRLQLCQLLHQVVQLGLEQNSERALRPYFHDLVLTFYAHLQDPFPAVQVEACTAFSILARSAALKLGMKTFAVGLVRALMPLLRHGLAKVRVAALDAIRDIVQVPDQSRRKGAGTDAIVELVGFRGDNVVPVATFYRNDVTINYLAEVSQDTHSLVRKHVVVLLGQWLTRLPDRYDHETRLLPFLLNALNDPVQEIHSEALQTLAACADLYASENDEEFREHQNHDNMYRNPSTVLQSALSLEALLPPPFQTRPRLATRLYVRSNTRRILPALVDELAHWTPTTRLLSAKLLRLLVVFCEDSLVDQLPMLLPALCKALALTESQDEELAAVLGQCAQLLGWWYMMVPSSQTAKALDMASLIPEKGTSDRSAQARDRLLAHVRAGMGVGG